MTHTPKYRRTLNDEQIEVLNLLYKFRFATSELIAQCFGKKGGVFVYKRLKILHEQGYIDKRFESTYRIKGRPAAYHLLPNGLKKLNESRIKAGKDKVVARWIYKEKTISEGFIDYSLDVLKIYRDLQTNHQDDLNFFTKNQLTNRYEYFSEFTPSVYIRANKDGTEQDIFLEYFQTNKPFFAIIQRLRQYAAYFDSGEWEEGTGSNFPTVLLVCDSQKLLSRLTKQANYVLGDIDEAVKIYATSLNKLNEWQSLADQDAEHLPLALI